MVCPNWDHNNHRERLPVASDTLIKRELGRAWYGKPNQGPPFGRSHHNWTFFRAITLREARKRGLDISITGLGT